MCFAVCTKTKTINKMFARDCALFATPAFLSAELLVRVEPQLLACLHKCVWWLHQRLQYTAVAEENVVSSTDNIHS